MMEPLVGEEGSISMVLFANRPGLLPFHVGSPLGGPLEVLEELHHG